jgi:hypothetical protein
MFTEKTVVSLVEVTPNGTIQVRLANQILDGETVKAQTFHRYCLAPGSDLTGEPDQVVAIANAVWTPEVVAAYEAQVAANQNPIGD